MGYEEHRRLASQTVLGCAVVIVSDSRDEKSDETGRTARKLLSDAGHKVVEYRLVKNDISQIRSVAEEMLQRADVQLIFLSGGTGIGRRDLTLEAVEPFIEKRIEGFGELFRQLSFKEIGGASMLSRATGAVARGKIVFCVPGSEKAARLALSQLIIPQANHMMWELRR